MSVPALFRLLALALTAALPATLFGQTASITLSNLERTYTATAQALDPATDIVVTPEEFAPYSISVTYSRKTAAPVNAGAYAVRVVATSLGNPTVKGTTTGTLLVAKAPLTVSADDQARLFGAPNPRFTLSYEGFLGADTEKVLNRRPAAKTTAKTGSPAGTYEITVLGGADNNYDLVARNPGTLSVVPAFPGTYEALLFASSDINVPVGKLSLTLPTRGTRFTGRLDLASQGSVLPLKGTLAPTEDLSGAQGVAERRLKNGDTYRIEFTVNAEGMVAALYLRPTGETENLPDLEVAPPVRLQPYTKANPAPTAGAYTLALLSPFSFAGFDHPNGAGHATVSITTSGQLKLAGKLADGAKLTASVASDLSHGYRLFVRPYGSRPDSYAAGGFTLLPHTDPDRAGAFFVPQSGIPTAFYWRKAPKPSGSPDKLFPGGFGPLNSTLVLDPWRRPAKATASSEAATLAQRLGLAVTADTSGFAEILFGVEDHGWSFLELPTRLEITPANKTLPVLFEAGVNPRAWHISVNLATGGFTGGFKLRDEVTDYEAGVTRVLTRTIRFQGVLRQAPPGDRGAGAGFYLLPPLPDAIDPSTRSADLRFERSFF